MSEVSELKGENSGLSVSYYKLPILHPINLPEPYTAECDDIIRALGMTFAEGCVFKAIWRSAAERRFGLIKQGTAGTQGVYDAEKMVYYSRVIWEERKAIANGDYSPAAIRLRLDSIQATKAPKAAP